MELEANAGVRSGGQPDSAPKGWQKIRLGVIFDQIVDSGHTENLPVLAVTLDRGVVRRSTLERKSEREVQRHYYLRALPGDIAYNTMRMWQGGSGLVLEEGYLSPAYTICRARKGEDSSFWAHAFKSESMIRSFRAHSQGFAKDRYRLYFQHFATVPTLRPPLPEQRKISTILSSVNDTIDKTEVVITALNSTKTAMLHELLTKGLPGQHSLFKPLPEEWRLGRLCGVREIPSSWRLVKLTSVARLESGHTPSRRTPEYWDGQIPWVSLHDSKNLNVPEIFETAQTISSLGLANSSARLLPEGTVAFSRTATVGKTAILGREMATSQDFANYICGSALYNRYLMHYFRHNQAEWERLMAGSTHKTIYMPVFRELQILLAPLEEQIRIADIADSLELRLAKERDAVGRLRELKSALSKTLLSGQLRVTPDEAPS